MSRPSMRRLIAAASRRTAVGRWVAGQLTVPGTQEVLRAEWHWYIDRVGPGMTVFDIGANDGLNSILFSNLVGESGAVWAFEPGRNAFRRLRRSIAAQRAANVRPIKAAVAVREGRAWLHVYAEAHDTKSSLFERSVAEVQQTPIGVEQVRTITLDRFCRNRAIERIDVLKIDAEGAEMQVLLGGRGLLEAKRIGCCLFEIGQTTIDAGTTPQAIFEYLAQLGYRVAPLTGPRRLLARLRGQQRVPFLMVVAEPA